MSSYRRGKFTFGDYPTAVGSATSAYHSGLVTSSASSLTRTNYSNPITSSLVNGSSAPTLPFTSTSSGISSRGVSRYTSSAHTGYSTNSKLTSTLATSSSRPLTSIATSSSTFTTRSPRLQSYLNAREERSKGSSSYTSSALAPPVPRSSRYDLESSRSRSYSHSGLYDHTSYRSRSSSVRETSPYDQERDRDLVLSMRSQSAMSSRANSANRKHLEPPTYTSTASASLLDDPMISTYSRSMTSDPLMTSSILGGSLSLGPASVAALSSSPPKKYMGGGGVDVRGGLDTRGVLDARSAALDASNAPRGSDEWSDATWLNNLRISAGMDPIPMPSSNSVASKAYEAVSTMPRMLENTHQPRMHRSNSSSDLRADIEAAVAAGIATAGPSRGGSAKQNPTGRARHQTLAYGVSASDLNLRNTEPLQVAGFSSTLLRNGSDMNLSGNDILVARVPSREGEVYDVRGFESDMSEAIMHAQISSSADNANAAAQASATDNAPHHTATSGTGQAGQNKNNNASSTSASENNSKINPSNHVGGTDRPSSATADRSQNGEIDYRKLWEQAQLDNSRLRDDLARTRDELSAAKKKLDTMVQTPSTTSGLTDTEKKEKIALEKKLSEMEEELKQLEHLKNDNQRLRDENGALIRVISKLSK